MADIFEDFERAYELVKTCQRDHPPMPWAIMASHSVPFERTFRQWTADGRLLLWVNRGAIHDLPLRRVHGGWMLFDQSLALGPLTSIPVFFE